MDYTSLPAPFPIPFGDSADPANIRDVPETPSGQAGAASLELGFPPDCFTPPSAGGTPPFGRDFNGLLKQVTAWSRWQGAGAPVKYDSTISTDIGGYPEGAVLFDDTNKCLWMSLVDNNTDNPELLTSTQWKAITPIQGTVSAAPSGVAQAIFTWPFNGSCYLVTATYGPSGQSAVAFVFAYQGGAVVFGLAAGPNITITSPNPSIYVTQTSGSPQNIQWSVFPLGVSP